MKTPIEKGQIRKGDVIRWEPFKPNDVVSIEYVAKGDGSQWRSHGQHFLLDRPSPPVALPTEPTLGWATGTFKSGRTITAVLGSWRLGSDQTLLNRTAHTYGDLEGDVNLPSDRITAFVPAIAVPTEALEKLRAVTDQDPEAGLAAWEWEIAVMAFLTAVDNANGADS